jgi:hypothetical protein
MRISVPRFIHTTESTKYIVTAKKYQIEYEGEDFSNSFKPINKIAGFLKRSFSWMSKKLRTIIKQNPS